MSCWLESGEGGKEGGGGGGVGGCTGEGGGSLNKDKSLNNIASYDNAVIIITMCMLKK